MFLKVLCIAVYAAADAPPQNDLQALISEVKTLRTALDRTTFVGLRVQLVLHRLGQQQNVVQQASSRAQQSEYHLTGLKAQQDRMQKSQQMFEERKRNAKDERAIAEIERESRWIRQETEALPKMLQDAETSRIEAQQLLRNEQAKLEDLQRQLDDLERRLAEISK